MSKIAIHGFGRIGRSTTRVALRDKLFVPFSISDIKDLSTLAAIFSVDTNYGLWSEEVKSENGKIIIGGREIAFFDTTQSLPDWGALGVDVVVDCTARATVRAGAQAHIDRGARKVLVSAPSKSLQDCDAVLLPGINLDSYNPEKHHIISMASCTTNALAPLVKVIKEKFGIKTGFFSTVHAYTSTQALTDQPMKERRDSWAAAENIIPSSSGAAKALKFIWPDLAITGKAYRIPVRTGSIVELNVLVDHKTSQDEVKTIFRQAANEVPLKGIMGVLEEEYASCRVVGESLSSLVDLPLVEVLEGQMLSVAAWYDNEIGYATRLAETAKKIAT
jgi:glyceraldehyde 3-phosphate dehydrogenase